MGKSSRWQKVTYEVSLVNVSAAYACALYVLSSMAGAPLPDAVDAHAVLVWLPPYVQNSLHIPVFAGLAWLCHRTLRPWIRDARLLGLVAFLLTAGYGGFDEWHQSHTPGRCASFADLGLDITGALLTLGFLNWRARIRRVQTVPSPKQVTGRRRQKCRALRLASSPVSPNIPQATATQGLFRSVALCSITAQEPSARCANGRANRPFNNFSGS